MTRPNPDDSKSLQIRKYPNRRYYDATRSRHVTLEDIHTAICEGYEVRVVDSKTDEEITAKVLAQIIIELDPPKLGVFPVPLLHGLLRVNQKLVGDFVDRYFNQPMTAFLDSQRNFEQYLRGAIGWQPDQGGPDWAKLMWGPLAAGWNVRHGPPATGAAAAAGPEAARPAAAAEGTDDLRRSVEELNRQVAQLQEQVKRAPRAARKRR